MREKGENAGTVGRRCERVQCIYIFRASIAIVTSASVGGAGSADMIRIKVFRICLCRWRGSCVTDGVEMVLSSCVNLSHTCLLAMTERSCGQNRYSSHLVASQPDGYHIKTLVILHPSIASLYRHDECLGVESRDVAL